MTSPSHVPPSKSPVSSRTAAPLDRFLPQVTKSISVAAALGLQFVPPSLEPLGCDRSRFN
jgi:hypothetical protein